MAASPQFTNTVNNTMLRIDSGDSLETLDWQAGADGGRLHQILVRVVADQPVVVNVSLRIGVFIYPFVRTIPPQIALADETDSTQPPTDLLTSVNFPGVGSSDESRALTFGADDGVRMSLGTTLVAGELVTIALLGGDY